MAIVANSDRAAADAISARDHRGNRDAAVMRNDAGR